jgi:UPF0042 nucleotide-binding protein
MELVIVTGLSGAGKSRAVNALEDMGFYCVDNMPPSLITKFAELCGSNKMLTKVAIVTDTRGGELFHGFFASLDDLLQQGASYKILFLDAADDVLVRRFRETRRKHPLLSSTDGSVTEAVEKERELLKPVRARADYIIDTSHISPAQLKERIAKLFTGDSQTGLMISCMSFGFKYGAPTEGDLVFDVRCLPNPYYIDELRPLTGLDAPIVDYVLACPQTEGFRVRLLDMIDYLMPLYVQEGKSQLVIAIGCTGGKHRSVVLTELLYKHLLDKGLRASVNHRDITKH